LQSSKADESKPNIGEQKPSSWMMGQSTSTGGSGNNAGNKQESAASDSSPEVVATTTANNKVSSTPVAPILSNPNPPPPLDLREWKGHRVLAKRSGLYMPGVITAVSGHSTITILFDRDNVSLPYTDVILSRTSFFDIVSDASPAPAQVIKRLSIKMMFKEEEASLFRWASYLLIWFIGDSWRSCMRENKYRLKSLRGRSSDSYQRLASPICRLCPVRK
jgi:hypothetical protein